MIWEKISSKTMFRSLAIVTLPNISGRESNPYY